MASIASQDYDDCEWIIKDAGSSDNSLEALSEFKRFPVKIVVQPDKGIYDGMNQALGHASGSYVHFLNAGDAYASPSVLSVIAYEISRRATEPSVIYTYYDDRATRAVVTYPAKLGRFFLYRSNVCHQAQFIRARDLSAVGGYDASYKLCADRELMLRVLRQPGCYSHRMPFPAVIYQGGGISAKAESLLLRDAENRRVNQEHFSSLDRYFFETIKMISFARWRAKILDTCEEGALLRTYARVRGIVRRWV